MSRILAHELSEAITKDGGSWPVDILRTTSRAHIALQSISDRNFNLAPESHKERCMKALRECVQAHEMRPVKGFER